MNQLEHQPTRLWSPKPRRAASSRMARFWESARGTAGLRLESYDDLWAWSVDHPERFWPLIGAFFGVRARGAWTPIRDRSELSGAGWFPQLSLNYTAQVFAGASPDRPALVIAHEDTPPTEVSWAELRDQVAAGAARLRSWGVRPGDRVAAYLPNSAEAVVGLLAAAAVGAVWSCCAPDYGIDAVVDRFAQIEPRVLLVTAGYSYAGRRVDRSDQASAIAARLPSVTHVVQVGDAPPEGWFSWADVIGTPADLVTEDVPFTHPLWILYSSGTTGLPKGIVHSHGGIVVQHLESLALQHDLGPGDRFFWFTTTGWMMWNLLISGLLVGSTVVAFDGSPGHPDLDVLWRMAADEGVTLFGTSASFVQSCL